MSLCCVFLTAFINTELVFHVVKIYTVGKTPNAVVSQYFIETKKFQKTMKKAGALLTYCNIYYSFTNHLMLTCG